MTVGSYPLRAMKRNLVALALLLLTAHAALAGTQPITHEWLFTMKRVGTPVPSPDGKWVLYPIAEPAYDEKDSWTDLWISPVDRSSEPRRLTYSKSAEGEPAWSPDGRRIAFSAKREGDEVNQIYVLDVSGGEAQRVTSLSSAAHSPQFRPDGKAILFSSSVYKGAADDEANKKLIKEKKDQKFKVRIYESFPIRNWDHWLDETQVHLFVQPLEPGAKAKDLLAGTNLVKEPGYSGRLAEGQREDLEAAWSPDGSAIVFTASTNRNTAAYAETSEDLYRMPAAGGEPQLLARDSGSYAHPQFSPDGKTLLVTFTVNNQKQVNNARIVRFDWPSGSGRKVVTDAPFDRSVNGFGVTPDGKMIYFTAEDAGLEKIYGVPATGGEVKLAVEPGRGVLTHLAIPQHAPQTVVIASYESSIEPSEVVRVDLTSGKFHHITTVNVEKALAIDWQPPRHFWFTSPGGRKIHSMLFVPAGFDETKKYPLLVLIHGGAASMWRDAISLRWNYHLLAKPGYVILATDYRGSTGYGEEFGNAIQGDPLKGPGDDINAAADEAIQRFPFIDGTRQAAAGASYGGHLANWMEASTTRYKCLIAHAGLINLESQWGTSDGIYHRELMLGGPYWGPTRAEWDKQNPIRYAANFKTPILVSVGEHDFRVPMNETLENWAILQRMRVPSRLLVWPDENHWILNPENSRVWYQEVAAWLAKWL